MVTLEMRGHQPLDEFFYRNSTIYISPSEAYCVILIFLIKKISLIILQENILIYMNNQCAECDHVDQMLKLNLKKSSVYDFSINFQICEYFIYLVPRVFEIFVSHFIFVLKL
jgi:hypothetical protein